MRDWVKQAGIDAARGRPGELTTDERDRHTVERRLEALGYEVSLEPTAA